MDGTRNVKPDHHRIAGCDAALRRPHRSAAGVENLERAYHTPWIPLVDGCRAFGVASTQFGHKGLETLGRRGGLGAIQPCRRVGRRAREIEPVDQRGDVQPRPAGDDAASPCAIEPIQAEPRSRKPVGDGERLTGVTEVDQMALHPIELLGRRRACPDPRSPRRTCRESALRISAGARACAAATASAVFPVHVGPTTTSSGLLNVQGVEMRCAAPGR